MKRFARSMEAARGRGVFRFPPKRSPAPVLVALLAAACGRSDEEWIRGLESADLLERELSAIAVTERTPSRGAAALPSLEIAIDRGQGALSRRACEALVKIAPFAVDEMSRRLFDDPFVSSDCRTCLAKALESAGTRVLPSIARRVGHPGYQELPDLERFALRLGEVAVDPLVDLLRADPDPSTRIGAAVLLGRLGPFADKASPALEEALRQNDPGIAAAAEEILGRVPLRRGWVAPELLAAFASPDPIRRARAAKSLSSSGVRPSLAISTRSASITCTSAIDRGNHADMTIEVRPLIAISSRLACTRLSAAE
jgi:hypothetical protein